MKRLENITVNKVILSIDVTSFGRELHIAYSDGSIEYRDRATLAEISGGLDRFTHLSQLGYGYADIEPCMFFYIQTHEVLTVVVLQIAFSTTNLSYAQIGLDGKVKWKCLEYDSPEEQNDGMQTYLALNQ